MEHEGRCVGNRVNAYTSDMDFHGGSKLSKLTYPIKTIYSKEARVQLRKVLDDFKPDVCQLSKSSVTSYLPYEKGVYFQAEEKEKLSVGAERQRRYRAVKLLRKNPCEETLWNCIVAFQGYEFKTISGLPFAYQLKKGRGNKFTKELWIDRRKSSKAGLLMGMVEFENSKQEALRIDILKDIGRHPGE